MTLGFHEGLCLASLAQTREPGYIDENGAWAIEPQFAFAYPLTDTLARVVCATHNGHPSDYIDHPGEVV